MILSQDFHDLVAAFEKANVKYLLIGGYAVAVHAKPRVTKDIDLWIASDQKNLADVARALGEFGAPQQAIEDVRSCAEDEIVWFGNPPSRVDLLKRIPGVDFDECYPRRMRLSILGIEISVLSIDDLITAKQAAGRPQDLLDVEALKAVKTDQ